MSSLLAVIAPDGQLPEDGVLLRALGRMGERGNDVREIVRHDRAAFAAGRYAWETEEHHSGRSCVFVAEDCTVIADASLYYREHLLKDLARSGVKCSEAAPAELIHAAYRAWGEAALDRLEGDYAFVIWDRTRNTVFAARDFHGMRALHYARLGRMLVFASTVGGIRSFPGCPSDIDLTAVAETISMWLAPVSDTCFSAIKTLPAGHDLRWEVSTDNPQVRRRWRAPRFTGEERPPVAFSDAALELRTLLDAAVAERMPEGGVTAITLSGGWDSPAVYAAAHTIRQQRGDSLDTLKPISISYPRGDVGCEDELIEQITGHHGQTTHWLPIGQIPLFPSDFALEIAAADDPFVHVYRMWNRALGRAAADLGARVTLNGVGGDHLFACDPSYLADLARCGRWVELVREFRREGMGSVSHFRDWVIRPGLSEGTRQLIGRARGGAAVQGFPSYTFPRWLNRDFVERNGLEERARSTTPVRDPADNAEGFERRWMLEHPFYARVASELFRLALADGVELRAPLMDRRLIEFAATRPRRERRSDHETKKLLRASVADALPPEVLAPRATKTGTTAGYLAVGMLRDYLALGDRFFGSSLLAELGIVDARALGAAMDNLRAGRLRGNEAGALVLTLSTEIWLRANVDSVESSRNGSTSLHGVTEQEVVLV